MRPAIKIASPAVNSILIESFTSTARTENAAGQTSIHIESTNAAGGAFNIKVRDGVFELPNSGAVKLLSCNHVKIDNCGVYDITIATGAPMFEIGKGATGPASSEIEIAECRSTVGSAAFPDLKMDMSVAAQGKFLISNSNFTFVDGVSVQGALVTVIHSTMTNIANLSHTQIGGSAAENIGFRSTSGTSNEFQIWNGNIGANDGYLNFSKNGVYLGSYGPSGEMLWGGTTAVPGLKVLPDGTTSTAGPMYPVSANTGLAQAACGLWAGVGAPNAAQGVDGDIYFRSGGGALTTIYQKRAGAWVGIV